MGKGKKSFEQVMEKALEKAAYKHLQYLHDSPGYAEWWDGSWDADEYQAWYSSEHPGSVSYSSRPLGKGKSRGRGYPQPAEPPLEKGKQGNKRASTSLEKDPTPAEAPAAEGWWRDPANADKEGPYIGPVNNKEKPTGSGTTSDARRKRRLGKQWDALEKAGAAYKPDDEESMDTHIGQLQQALEKAQQRKEQLRGTSPSPGGASSTSSHADWQRPSGPSRPHSRRGRRTLEKVQEEDQQEPRTLRRQRSLSQGKFGPRVDPEATRAALEKAREEIAAAQLGKAEQAEANKPTLQLKASTKARPKFKEEQEQEQEALEKDNPGSSSKPTLASLEKEAWERMLRDQARDLARPKKAKVCLDWHNTLEKGDIVPEAHLQALDELMRYCSVVICSYVKTKKREAEVKKGVLALEKDMGLEFHLPLFFTYEKTGQRGKLHTMWYEHVDYIVDDAWQVLKETLEKGYPKVYPIAVQTPDQDHWRFQERKGITVVKDFPAAVVKILQDLEVID